MLTAGCYQAKLRRRCTGRACQKLPKFIQLDSQETNSLSGFYTYFSCHKNPSTLQPTLHCRWFSMGNKLKGWGFKPFKPFRPDLEKTSPGLDKTTRRVVSPKSGLVGMMQEESDDGETLKTTPATEPSWRVWSPNPSATFALSIKYNEGLAEGLNDFSDIEYTYKRRLENWKYPSVDNRDKTRLHRLFKAIYLLSQ